MGCYRVTFFFSVLLPSFWCCGGFIFKLGLLYLTAEAVSLCFRVTSRIIWVDLGYSKTKFGKALLQGNEKLRLFSHLIGGIKMQKENKPGQTVVDTPEIVQIILMLQIEIQEPSKTLPNQTKYPETNL